MPTDMEERRMGYVYQDGRLCCDCCGAVGARKRPCPVKVPQVDGGDLPCCPATAMCADCRAKYPEPAWLEAHKRCKDYAAKRTAAVLEERSRLERGDLQLIAGYGDWDDTVPAGYVGAIFSNSRAKPTTERAVLIPKEEYRPTWTGDRTPFLSDFPNAKPWGVRP